MPASVATAVAIALYALLPVTLVLGPRLVIPVLEAVLLAMLVAGHPIPITRETRWSRITSLALIALIAATNLVALALLLRQLTRTTSQQSTTLLMAAGQVWLTNVIV